MELKQQLIGQRDLLARRMGKVGKKTSAQYIVLHERWDEFNRRIAAI